MVSWVFAAGPAGFAFIVSFLIGLISGVGFLSILLRAFVSGLIFSALGIGIAFLGRMFFPDLIPDQKNTVDRNTDSDDESDKSFGGTVDITLEDEEADDTAESAMEGDELIAEGDRFVEEIQPSPSSDPGVSLSGEDSDEVVDSVESIDGLPSLDVFSDSFDSAWNSDSADEPSVSGRDAEVDILGETQNPGDVARAVKTMMKRDQEG